MKRRIFFPVVLILMLGVLFSACDLGFLDNDDDGTGEALPSNYWDYDDISATNYYKSGEDDSVISYAEYNFDANDKCVQIKEYLASGDTDPLIGASTFSWEGDNLKSKTNWNFNSEKTYHILLSYDGEDRVTAKTEYSVSGDVFTPAKMQSWSYTAGGELERTDYYVYDDDSDTLAWDKAYQYEYTANLMSRSSLYSGDLNGRSAYIKYEYDSSDSIMKKIGYGDTIDTDSHYKPFGSISPGKTGATKAERELLLHPETEPSLPTVTEPTLTDDTASYSWLYMTEELDYAGFGGSAAVTLNGNYMPKVLRTEVTGVDEIEEPVTIKISYERDYFPVEKTTYYGNDLILKLNLAYDGPSNFLSDISVSGDATYTSMQCHIDYDSNKVPKAITLGIANVPTLKFKYIYTDGASINPLEFFESVQTIEQYTLNNGVESLFATYTIQGSVAAKELTLAVSDALDASTGKFVLYYDDDGLLAGVKSFDADDNVVWDYNYSYDELKNRVSEIKLEDFNDVEIPEIFDTFDIESLLGDLSRYMPDYYDNFEDSIPADLL